MKHRFSITALLILLFVIAQITGLSLVFLDQDVVVDDAGNQVVEHHPTVIGEPPETEGWQAALFIAFGITLGTVIILLLIKYKAYRLWKLWFLVAVWLALGVALGVFMPANAALSLAFIVALWKVYRPNAIVHNVTEVLIYAGIAVLIARMFDLLWITIVLVLISIYDMIAVWKSKHMIKMAEAQTKSNIFAGLYIPKGKKQKEGIPPPPKPKQNVAILGGGDIAFPLLFSSVVLVWLIERNVAPTVALNQTLIVTACATIALSLLFAYSKKGKFYPAMPFISAGCFIGFAIVALL